MKVTLGGDRLGSGNKNKIALHDYERSTHNLSQKFTSSMQCGTLYPFLVLPAMRGDKFEINLRADARTIPTRGPLFGSFKMQIDIFQCDFRLYQAILHNNPLSIGLKMNQVKFPILRIADNMEWGAHAFNNSCLMKYLGLSGIGSNGNLSHPEFVQRDINAIPALAYYEIFKTYYSNKQEEKAYIIDTIEKEDELGNYEFKTNNATYGLNQYINYTIPLKIKVLNNIAPFNEYKKYIYITYSTSSGDTGIIAGASLENLIEQGNAEQTGINEFVLKETPLFPSTQIPTYIKINKSPLLETDVFTYYERGLQPFTLANIDDMRLALLSHHQLGVPFKIVPNGIVDTSDTWGTASGTDGTGLPYTHLVDVAKFGYDYEREETIYKSRNCQPLNGLCIKTYQADLMNNWVNTEWIDGENGIAEITAISTQDGKVLIDSLNLAEKMYNMLNRIAVSDGSYEGWQDAVYTETPKRHIESPVYLGGMSSEIMFEEIVQTSPDGDGLGTLGGKGKLIKGKGGHVTVKVNEGAFIIGIVSLTPRVNYSQGNEFYLTELQSMDDLHKPALDGIGFQNLIGERLAWWDTKLTNNAQGVSSIQSRSTIGKVPAWIEYMTAVDKCYGDFAETEGRGFMNLLREYDRTENNEIGDATTYIDPRKYNYAFAYKDIDAQNFWVQIYSDIKARRLMSAKQIPNI